MGHEMCPDCCSGDCATHGDTRKAISGTPEQMIARLQMELEAAKREIKLLKTGKVEWELSGGRVAIQDIPSEFENLRKQVSGLQGTLLAVLTMPNVVTRIAFPEKCLNSEMHKPECECGMKTVYHIAIPEDYMKRLMESLDGNK